MSKQAKKRPKPVPCERWGVYNKRGRFLFMTGAEAGAIFVASKSEGEFVHRVRIVPVVAKAKRRKGAK